MAYVYTLPKHFKVKEQKTYPWPCESSPKRTIELFTFYVLTKSGNGFVTKHTGLCMTGIIVPDSDLEEVEDPVNLHVSGSLY